ncbi:MAG: DUF2339 domain-containing protein [Hyphomicrobiales bacterium]
MESAVIFGIGLLVLIVVGSLLGFAAFFGMRKLRQSNAGFQQDLAALQLEVKTLAERLANTPTSAAPPQETEAHQDQAEPEASDAEELTQTSAAPPPLPPQLPETAEETPERAYAAQSVQDTPERTSSLDAESTIGGKITIWVGGLALAFGGLFLVRYAIENAVLSPAARVMLGFAFGALVAALGEWTRRRPGQYALPGFERANIPAILTSVGIFIMFAAVYAAHGLYELIGPVVAFAALSVLALGVMALSLVHGPALGGLGLVVSYAVPFLISTETDSILGLAIYVLAVSAAALAVARIRGWLWLALSAIGAMFAFAVLFQVTVPFSEPVIVSLYLAAAFALAFTTFVLSIHDRSVDPDSGIDWLATAVLSLLVLPIVLHFHESQDLPIQVIEMAVLFAVPMAIAYAYPAMRYVVILPALIACARYLTMSVPATQASAEQLLSPSLLTIEILASVPTYASIGAIASAALLAWSSWATLRSPARAPIVATAAASALLLLFIAYGRITQFFSTGEFTGAALVLFALFHIQASILHARIGQGAPGRDQAIASALIGSLVALAFAAAVALQGAGLTIALGLIAGATVVTYLRYPLVELRIFAVLAVLPYAARLMWEPFIDPTALISAPPVFNILLWGYGIPTAGFIASAVVLTRARNDIWAQLMQAAAIVASVVTVALLALHAIDPFFRFFGRTDALAASATLVMVGGAFSLGLTRLDSLGKSQVLSRGADVLGGLGILGGAVSLFLLFNPVLGPVGVRFGSIRVGESLIFNLIGYAYALPALLFALVVRQGWEKKHKAYINLALGFTALLAFAWVNLTIRQVFSPNNLTLEPVREAELYTYSVVWLLIGIAMLAAGIRWRNFPLRAASGLVLVVVVLKVFLVDLSNLDGILRAISFIGLGAVLLGIGVVYQRALRSMATPALKSDQPG